MRDGGIADWWYLDGLSFKPSVEIYAGTKTGYVGDVRPTQEVVDAYWKEFGAFQKANPLPVELVNYCSYDHPAYILAVRGSVRTALRGDPTDFEPKNLSVSTWERDTLLNFCVDHGIENEAEPTWLLSSCWG